MYLLIKHAFLQLLKKRGLWDFNRCIFYFFNHQVSKIAHFGPFRALFLLNFANLGPFLNFIRTIGKIYVLVLLIVVNGALLVDFFRYFKCFMCLYLVGFAKINAFVFIVYFNKII